MKPLHTAFLVIGAMLASAGITYWALRHVPPPAPLETTIPLSSIDSAAQVKRDDEPMLPVPPTLDATQLDAAIAAAKVRRARGELQAAATTPEGFARELGAFNFRLVQFSTKFPTPPTEPQDAITYRESLAKLTSDYAILTLDEGLLATAEDGTPEQFARLQAHLAGGCLGLDVPTIAKLKEILHAAYADLFPLDDTAPDADAKLEAVTNQIAAALSKMLSPEQQTRLDLMGADRVLFGLRPTEPSPEP
jgi:hypothetical protein